MLQYMLRLLCGISARMRNKPAPYALAGETAGAPSITSVHMRSLKRRLERALAGMTAGAPSCVWGVGAVAPPTKVPGAQWRVLSR